MSAGTCDDPEGDQREQQRDAVHHTVMPDAPEQRRPPSGTRPADRRYPAAARAPGLVSAAPATSASADSSAAPKRQIDAQHHEIVRIAQHPGEPDQQSPAANRSTAAPRTGSGQRPAADGADAAGRGKRASAPRGCAATLTYRVSRIGSPSTSTGTNGLIAVLLRSISTMPSTAMLKPRN